MSSIALLFLLGGYLLIGLELEHFLSLKGGNSSFFVVQEFVTFVVDCHFQSSGCISFPLQICFELADEFIGIVTVKVPMGSDSFAGYLAMSHSLLPLLELLSDCMRLLGPF